MAVMVGVVGHSGVLSRLDDTKTWQREMASIRLIGKDAGDRHGLQIFDRPAVHLSRNELKYRRISCIVLAVPSEEYEVDPARQRHEAVLYSSC
jgi:hypothetical protein